MNAPRGTRVFFPDEMEQRRFVKNTLRGVVESYGYREIATPTFEFFDLFALKSGEEIEGQMYIFTDKKGRKLVLRPEMTAPVMRAVSGIIKSEPKPIRLYYFANNFRYERPQAGRYREFFQFGVESIGGDDDAMDAEIIRLSVDMLKSVGLEDFVVRVNNISEGSMKLLRDVEMVFDGHLQRGLDYYTGMVFEIDVPSLGAQKQVCGGGNYSLPQILHDDVSTRGFAIGFDRLMLAIPLERNSEWFMKKRVCVVATKKEYYLQAIGVAKQQRERGHRVTLIMKNRNGAIKYAKHYDFDECIGIDDGGEVVLWKK